MVKLINRRMNILKDETSSIIQYDNINIVLGNIYKYKLLSSSTLISKLSLIFDTAEGCFNIIDGEQLEHFPNLVDNCYIRFFSTIFKRIIIFINDTFFYFVTKLIICINENSNSELTSIISKSLLDYIKDYVDSLIFLSVRPTVDNNSLITNIVSFSIFYFDSIISFVNIISSVIDNLCNINDQADKIIGCYIKYFFEYIQPYLDIFFPCGSLYPLEYIEPKTKIKVPKEHILVGIVRVILKAFEIDIPETSPKTVSIPTI